MGGFGCPAVYTVQEVKTMICFVNSATMRMRLQIWAMMFLRTLTGHSCGTFMHSWMPSGKYQMAGLQLHGGGWVFWIVKLNIPVTHWYNFQVNGSRYHPAWASLARDYLSIMSSSVSSERAFSQGGITIRKRWNRLKGDIVGALQCVKCAIRHDLLFREPGPSSIFEAEVTAVCIM